MSVSVSSIWLLSCWWAFNDFVSSNRRSVWLQKPPWSASLLGTTCARTAHQDHGTTWKNRRCVEEALDSPLLGHTLSALLAESVCSHVDVDQKCCGSTEAPQNYSLIVLMHVVTLQWNTYLKLIGYSAIQRITHMSVWQNFDYSLIPTTSTVTLDGLGDILSISCCVQLWMSLALISCAFW